MRRKDKEITEIALVEEVIRRSLVCRLGLSLDDRPYVVPLCFGYRNNTLYFHSAGEGSKLEILQKNPNVCVEFDIDQEVVQGDSPCTWSMRYRSAIGYGRAFLITAAEEKCKGLDVIMQQYSGKSYSFSRAALASVVVIRVDIENITGKSSGF